MRNVIVLGYCYFQPIGNCLLPVQTLHNIPSGNIKFGKLNCEVQVDRSCLLLLRYHVQHEIIVRQMRSSSGHVEVAA